MNVSVVVPIYNEQDNILNLYNEIKEAFNKIQCVYQIVFVDDFSQDRSKNILNQLELFDEQVKVFSKVKNLGQSEAIKCGIRAADYEIIAVLDGDGQNDPHDFLKLFANLTPETAMVRGVRLGRKDTFIKKIQSYLGNRLIQVVIGHPLHDLGCSLKIFRRDLALPLFVKYNFHRYIAVLFYKKKYLVKSVPVSHRLRKHGNSNYSWTRGIYLMRDLYHLKMTTQM